MPMFRLTAPTWKLFAICGRAVAMIVPSRFSMKKALAMRLVMQSGEGAFFIHFLVYEMREVEPAFESSNAGSLPGCPARDQQQILRFAKDDNCIRQAFCI